MNFELSEDQVAFSDMARAFAQNELEPRAAEWDAESFFPVDVIRKAGELGFCSLYAPESVGGLGLSRLDASIIFEQLSNRRYRKYPKILSNSSWELPTTRLNISLFIKSRLVFF